MELVVHKSQFSFDGVQEVICHCVDGDITAPLDILASDWSKVVLNVPPAEAYTVIFDNDTQLHIDVDIPTPLIDEKPDNPTLIEYK